MYICICVHMSIVKCFSGMPLVPWRGVLQHRWQRCAKRHADPTQRLRMRQEALRPRGV